MNEEEAINTLKKYLSLENKWRNRFNRGTVPEAIEIVLQVYRQDKKVIQEMAKYIEDTVENDICNKENCFADKYENGHCKKCVNCIIDYFRKKCE